MFCHCSIASFFFVKFLLPFGFITFEFGCRKKRTGGFFFCLLSVRSAAGCTRCATAPKLPHGSHRTTSFSRWFSFNYISNFFYLIWFPPLSVTSFSFQRLEKCALHVSDYGPEPMTHFDPGPKERLLRLFSTESGNRRDGNSTGGTGTTRALSCGVGHNVKRLTK